MGFGWASSIALYSGLLGLLMFLAFAAPDQANDLRNRVNPARPSIHGRVGSR